MIIKIKMLVVVSSLVVSGLYGIGYAESDDGLSWTKNPEPVLDPGLGWEDWLVYHPSVVFDGSDYHMWYSAHDGGSHNSAHRDQTPTGLNGGNQITRASEDCQHDRRAHDQRNPQIAPARDQPVGLVVDQLA